MNPEDRLRSMIGAARETTSGGADGWEAFMQKAHRALFMRRAAVVSGAVALVAVAAFSASVLLRGGDAGPSLPPAGAPTESPSPSETPSPQTSPSSAEPAPVERFPAEVWLVDEDGVLFFGWTNVPFTDEAGEVSSQQPSGSTEQRLALVMEALLASPTGPDVEAGASTAIPEGTRLLGVTVAGDVAIVDLSEEFGSGGGGLSMQLRVAQVVFQATQVEGIDRVRLAIEGEQVDAIGGEGLIVDHPMDRTEFENVSPPVVLVSPKIGASVSSPLTIEGIANVFEANVNIRILGEDGKPLVETFTTATCGTGCWGTYSEKVRFQVESEQEGRVEVLTYSAEDGSPQDVISIPVILQP